MYHKGCIGCMGCNIKGAWGVNIPFFTARQGDTLGIQRRQDFHVNTVRCKVYTKGVGCNIKECMGCNIEGVWGVNIPFLLCDKVIHLGYNGDKFFR